MPLTQPSPTAPVVSEKLRDWLRLLLGLATGVLGGVIQSKILGAPLTQGALLGGAFGFTFSVFFSRRATAPGAGLIWGLKKTVFNSLDYANITVSTYAMIPLALLLIVSLKVRSVGLHSAAETATATPRPA